ncbi:hypothetical protein [Microlunatus flavus]|uniref:Uncharacterized protein n=1 Tax=Microlunatus flavus TaxID=1036181 RepID=A0A1H9FQW6_9ACTN|nr:hypothetical protein [Microlunatus flavus]SEQ40286.1 hypothetical protein SAMN05421756_103351 [Microlunatus flavus]
MWRVLLVWLVPMAVAVAAVVVAVTARRSRQLDGLRRALSIAAVLAVVVPAFFLVFPTQRHDVNGVVECPLSGAAQSVMPGDHDSELYRFWEPCVRASRRAVGLSTGGYALVAGLVGLVVLNAPRRDRAPQAPTRTAVRL